MLERTLEIAGEDAANVAGEATRRAGKGGVRETPGARHCTSLKKTTPRRGTYSRTGCDF
jgi:hypothetical protein